MKLQDLIDLEGKRSLLSHLDKEKGVYEGKVKHLDEIIEDVVGEMEAYDDPERRKEIMNEFSETLRRFTMKLGVYSLSDNVFKSITASIEESGSDLPRALLAYFYTTLSAINKNGNATHFPVIIDAPNQQEQDPKNLEKMLKFIVDNRPSESQLIIGLVDDAGVGFGGKTILFDKKYSVLDEGYYQESIEEIRYFEASNLAID